MRLRAGRLALVYGTAAVVVVLDQLTKWLVVRQLGGGRPLKLLGSFLQLRYTTNSGGAFSLFTGAPLFFALTATVIAGGIVYAARRAEGRALLLALGLLLGGAMGNLGDRLFRGPGPFRGQVVDWLNLPHFPWTFNLADASISCAAVLIAVLALRGVRIDGISPAHAADRIGGTPSVAPAPRDGTARLIDSDECAS